MVAKPKVVNKKIGKRQIAVQVNPVPPAAAVPTVAAVAAVTKPTTPKPKYVVKTHTPRIWKAPTVDRHRVNTLFWRAVTSTLSQRLLHKMTYSSAVFMARLHVC